jgi:hypothetical protein
MSDQNAADTMKADEFDIQDTVLTPPGPRGTKFFQPIVDLGLERHVAELAGVGYTVVPPEKVAPAEFLERIRDAVLRISAQRRGVVFQPDRNPDLEINEGVPNSVYEFYLLFEDPVFEEWLENETLGALVDYAMVGQAQLSSMSSILKWKGGTYGPGLGLHSDASGSPEGRLSTGYNAICNGAYCLSDYSADGGAIAMVPGSHRLGRQPNKGDGIEDAVPVEAPAGSLIFWVANMWHGAYPRTIDGLRMTLTNYFCHRAFKTQERYQMHVPDEMLARHSARFARFLGADDFNGWGKEGPGPGAARAANYQQRTRDASK